MRASISLWSADVRSLDGVVSRVAAEADSFHVDVVGHGPGQEPLLGPALIRALRARTAAPIEVHLLVPDPAAWIERCAQAGASTIIVSCRRDVRQLLHQVRASGARAALSLDIDTPVDAAMEHFDLIDAVIVMGCFRHGRGAGLHPDVPDRISTLVEARQLNSETPDEPVIFVEGAVREHTLQTLADAGSDGVVVGAPVLGTLDPLTVIREIDQVSSRRRTPQTALSPDSGKV